MKDEDKQLYAGIGILAAIGGYLFYNQKKKQEAAAQAAKPSAPQAAIPQGFPQGIPQGIPQGFPQGMPQSIPAAIPVPQVPQGGGATPVSAAEEALKQAAAAAGLPTVPKIW